MILSETWKRWQLAWLRGVPKASTYDLNWVEVGGLSL